MPWSVSQSDRCPASKPWGVMREHDQHMEGCHATEMEAKTHMQALYAQEPQAKICKINEDEQLVFGWASVATDNSGALLIDSDGEAIEPDDLEKAAYEYVLNAREANEMHGSDVIGKMVESFVLTPEKASAMGLSIPPMTGWWFGVHVEDSDAFAKVKNGTYKMFSIEGAADVEEVTA